MKMNLMCRAALLLLAAMTLGRADQPGSGSALSNLPTLADAFSAGRYEATLASCPMFSPFVASKNRPTINYTFSEFQLGYMLTDVETRDWLRGNVEILGSGFGGTIFKGKGSYVSGVTCWLRYNLIPERWRVIPYAQFGAGVTFTDIDRNIVGQTFNFNLNLGAGLRCFIARNWSINLEYRYQHISNANLGPKNIGINSIGPLLGVSFFF